jgi:hypothetical protein
MSKYIYFDEIVFASRELLLAALRELGYAQVEEGESLPLYGYQGDRRPETAALVVRRQHLGRTSNDLGFARTADGFVPIISEYDQQHLLGGRLLVKLRTTYSENVVEAVRARLRGSIRRTVEDGLVRIQVRF